MFTKSDITQYIDNYTNEFKVFDTVLDMLNEFYYLITENKLDAGIEYRKKFNLPVVQYICKTLGYYKENDGGGGFYKIKQIESSDYTYKKLINSLKYSEKNSEIKEIKNKDKIKILKYNAIQIPNTNYIAVLYIDDVVNVKQFGAYSDGTRDNTEVFQTCFDYAIENKKNLYIPEGTYILNNSIVLKKQSQTIKIYGDTYTKDENDGTIIKTSAKNGFISGYDFFNKNKKAYKDIINYDESTESKIVYKNNNLADSLKYKLLPSLYIEIENITLNNTLTENYTYGKINKYIVSPSFIFSYTRLISPNIHKIETDNFGIINGIIENNTITNEIKENKNIIENNTFKNSIYLFKNIDMKYTFSLIENEENKFIIKYSYSLFDYLIMKNNTITGNTTENNKNSILFSTNITSDTNSKDTVYLEKNKIYNFTYLVSSLTNTDSSDYFEIITNNTDLYGLKNNNYKPVIQQNIPNSSYIYDTVENTTYF